MRGFLVAALLCAFAAPAPAENLLLGPSGIASCYGNEHGQWRTATGARFDPRGLTAAHRTLSFGTKVLVCRVRADTARQPIGTDADRCVTVTINDRGPYVRGRIIDLSLGACGAIRLSGIARVSLQIIGVSHEARPSFRGGPVVALRGRGRADRPGKGRLPARRVSAVYAERDCRCRAGRPARRLRLLQTASARAVARMRPRPARARLLGGRRSWTLK